QPTATTGSSDTGQGVDPTELRVYMISVESYDGLRFARGYLVVPRERCVDARVPGSWTRREIAGYAILTHPDTDLHVLVSDRQEYWVLIGHAYDPWSGLHEETALLRELDAGFRRSEEDLFR